MLFYSHFLDAQTGQISHVGRYFLLNIDCEKLHFAVNFISSSSLKNKMADCAGSHLGRRHTSVTVGVGGGSVAKAFSHGLPTSRCGYAHCLFSVLNKAFCFNSYHLGASLAKKPPQRQILCCDLCPLPPQPSPQRFTEVWQQIFDSTWLIKPFNCRSRGHG